MTSDERMMTKPDERLTTTPEPAEEIRGRHEERIVDQSGVASIQPPAAAGKVDPNVGTARPVQPARQDRADGALFQEGEIPRLRDRWVEIQSGFVDEPRRAVKEADELVLDITKRLTDMFAAERTALERQWDRNDNVTTEDLRVALKRYHSFFDRLLSV